MGFEQGLPFDEEQGAPAGKEAELQAEILKTTRTARTGWTRWAGRSRIAQRRRLWPNSLPCQMWFVSLWLSSQRIGGKECRCRKASKRLPRSLGGGMPCVLVEGTRASGKRRWRRSLYVPKEMPEDHRIAAMVGLEAATRLSFSPGNCIVELPSCFALRKAYAADHALRLSNAGATQAEIGQRNGR